MRRSHQFDESQIEMERCYHEQRAIKGMIAREGLKIKNYEIQSWIVFWVIVILSFIVVSTLLIRLGSII